MFRLNNTETGEFVDFTTEQLLEELNRDRGSWWDDYTLDDSLREIVEGVETFTEYTFN